MCVHICTKCHKPWSHQDFPTQIINEAKVYDPCPREYPIIMSNAARELNVNLHLVCLQCTEQAKRRGEFPGLTWRKMVTKMDDDAKRPVLDGPKMIEITNEEEATFMRVKEMGEEALEAHYRDIEVKLESFRIRALTYKRLKATHDLERFSRFTDEERAEFLTLSKRKPKGEIKDQEELKAKVLAREIRKAATDMIKHKPTLSMDEALKRAKGMFA